MSLSKAAASAAIYDSKTFEPRNCVGRLLALVKLADADADSASNLCRSASYDQGAMTRMIDRLERKGLVRRVRSPSDRRRVNLELTPEGRAVYPKLIESAANVQNRFLRGFNETDAQQLEGLLRRMLANR